MSELFVDAVKDEALRTVASHFPDRTGVLFLGAGVNAGTVLDGAEFPLGQQLASALARDLLEEPNVHLSLSEVAEIARYKLGDRPVNDYIFNYLGKFRPSTVHHVIVSLPWDVIYTTNYDLLIEAASTVSGPPVNSTVAAVTNVNDDVSNMADGDLVYYKLHGSIDVANTDHGRLFLSSDDYRSYSIYRKPLFKRLRDDLEHKTFLFAGYSLKDSNFRTVLDDVRSELGSHGLPRSVAVIKDFSPVEAIFWREKYNVLLVRSDATDFLQELKSVWLEKYHGEVTPLDKRQSRTYASIDPSTEFPVIGESFYRVSVATCTGPSDPKLYFAGAQPRWADVRDGVPALRDEYWSLMEALYSELIEPSGPVSAYLVTGHAGTGKTTFVMQALYDIAHDFDTPVLVHIPGTPLDARVIAPLASSGDPQRITVFVPHAAMMAKEIADFVVEAQRLKLPLSVVLEERHNQWQAAIASVNLRLQVAEITLGSLSGPEISRILDALGTHNMLGKLTGTPRSYQEEHFRGLAHKELLVALRELTSDNASFDDIVRDEYIHIPSGIAQRAYVYVAAVAQVGLSLRYANLISIMDLRYDQLGPEILKPADGVLISGEALGASRHNAGFRLGTRHPIIASVIFAAGAATDEAKYEVLNDIISSVDPGFIDDRKLLEEIVRRKDIVNTLADVEKRRAVYDRLADVLKDNPYVLQHRSILERDLGDGESALRFARAAVAIDRRNPILLNTLGLALEFASRYEEDGGRRQALLAEAERIFDDGIRKDPSDPYTYMGKVQILRNRAAEASTGKESQTIKASILALLVEAMESTDENPMITGALADERRDLGNVAEAIDLVRDALTRKPQDSRLRQLMIELLVERGELKSALEEAIKGVGFDATSWRLQRHIARLLRLTGGSQAAIRGHYEAAVRHRRGDVGLAVELAAFLFMSGDQAAAAQVFENAKSMNVPAWAKRRVSEWWKDSTGARRQFTGNVKRLSGNVGNVFATPDNFEAFFWRTQGGLENLRVGDSVFFTVGFNAFGPLARVQRSEP